MIDLEHDEKEWFIDEYEPEVDYQDYDYSDLMLQAEMLDFPGVALKSADSWVKKGPYNIGHMTHIFGIQNRRCRMRVRTEFEMHFMILLLNYSWMSDFFSKMRILVD